MTMSLYIFAFVHGMLHCQLCGGQETTSNKIFAVKVIFVNSFMMPLIIIDFMAEIR